MDLASIPDRACRQRRTTRRTTLARQKVRKHKVDSLHVWDKSSHKHAPRLRKMRSDRSVHRTFGETTYAAYRLPSTLATTTIQAQTGQYLLREPPPGKSALQFSWSISAKLRAQVLDHNGFTCQMCGLTPGEVDPQTARKVRLHIGHIVDKNLAGKDELSNLRALCSTCNQGAKNITSEKPTSFLLLSQVRRAGHDEQLRLLRWLQEKFDSRS